MIVFSFTYPTTSPSLRRRRRMFGAAAAAVLFLSKKPFFAALGLKNIFPKRTACFSISILGISNLNFQLWEKMGLG